MLLTEAFFDTFSPKARCDTRTQVEGWFALSCQSRAEVGELVAGGWVRGELVAAAGPDLHLATGRGVVVLDTRLMTGWEIVAAGEERGLTVPVREFREAAGVQDGLF